MQAAAAAVARGLGRYDARVEQDRVNDLNDRSRLVAVRAELNIVLILYEAGREDACAALAAEQDDALVKHRQAVNDARTADHAADLAFDAVEEADIDGIEPSVKLHALDVNLHAEQLRRARLDGCDAAGIEQFLRIPAQIDADVAQALFAPAGVIDFLGVDTDRLAETAGSCIIIVTAADRTGAADFISHVYYLQKRD